LGSSTAIGRSVSVKFRFECWLHLTLDHCYDNWDNS
jgi:hypothetical protein